MKIQRLSVALAGLANENTEPGVHILATRTRTFVALQRDRRRRVLRP
jgi:hypothetical protein